MTGETMTLGEATLYDRADRRQKDLGYFRELVRQSRQSGSISMPTPSRRSILRRRSFPKAITPRKFCRLRRCSRSAF